MVVEIGKGMKSGDGVIRYELTPDSAAEELVVMNCQVKVVVEGDGIMLEFQWGKGKAEGGCELRVASKSKADGEDGAVTQKRSRRGKLDGLTEEKLRAMAESGLSDTEIAAQYGCIANAVWLKRKKWGIPSGASFRKKDSAQ